MKRQTTTRSLAKGSAHRTTYTLSGWALLVLLLGGLLLGAPFACNKGGDDESSGGESAEAEEASFETVDVNIGNALLAIDLPPNYELERLTSEGQPDSHTILKWEGSRGEPQVRVGIAGQNPITRPAPTSLEEAVGHVQRGPTGQREIIEQSETDTTFEVVGTDGTWTHYSFWLRGDPTLRCWVEYRSPESDDPRLDFAREVCRSLARR